MAYFPHPSYCEHLNPVEAGDDGAAQRHQRLEDLLPLLLQVGLIGRNLFHHVCSRLHGYIRENHLI